MRIGRLLLVFVGQVSNIVWSSSAEVRDSDMLTRNLSNAKQDFICGWEVFNDTPFSSLFLFSLSHFPYLILGLCGFFLVLGSWVLFFYLRQTTNQQLGKQVSTCATFWVLAAIWQKGHSNKLSSQQIGDIDRESRPLWHPTWAPSSSRSLRELWNPPNPNPNPCVGWLPTLLLSAVKRVFQVEWHRRS